MSQQQRYELLALALSYPHPDLMTAIREGSYDKEFGKTAPLPASLEELEIEYCRLFVGPGHVEVPPYESVYRGHDIKMQEGLVMGQVSEKVEKFYHQTGLQLAPEFHDMPDHIAVETWFLAYLEAMAKDNSEGDYWLKKQQFVEEHLRQWTIPFTEAVKRVSRHPWYIYACQLLAETIAAEPTGTRQVMSTQ